MIPTDAVQVCDKVSFSDLTYCLLGHTHLSLQDALNPAVAGAPWLQLLNVAV